jgi:hypothetical protein
MKHTAIYLSIFLSCSGTIFGMHKFEQLKYKQQRYLYAEPDFFSPRLQPSPRDLESPTSQKVALLSDRRKAARGTFFKTIASSLMTQPHKSQNTKSATQQKSNEKKTKDEVGFSTVDLGEKFH